LCVFRRFAFVLSTKNGDVRDHIYSPQRVVTPYSGLQITSKSNRVFLIYLFQKFHKSSSIIMRRDSRTNQPTKKQRETHNLDGREKYKIKQQMIQHEIMNN